MSCVEWLIRPDDGSEGLVGAEEIAHRTGLPEAWVLSALESNLLTDVFGGRNYTVQVECHQIGPVGWVLARSAAGFGH